MNAEWSREKAIEHAYCLLDCAMCDILAASLLFERRFYALSIYHLQQAAEKAGKSFHAYTGSLDECQMRKAGHDWLKVDSFVMKRLKEVSEDIESAIPGSRKELEGLRSIRDALPPMTKIAKASRDSILLFVLDIDLERMLEPVNGVAGITSTKSKNHECSVSMRDEVLAIAHITNIAIVTTPHAWHTRYPTQNGGELAPRDYTNELGIVQAAPELIVTLKNAVGVIQKIYRSEKKGPYERFMTFEARPRDELDAIEGEVVRIRLRRP